MFTTGQWTFAALFLIAFIIIITYTYIKDKKLHKKEYKGSIWILLGFLLFIGLLFVIKIVLGE